MEDSISLRFRLARELMRLRYGDVRIIDGDTAYLAWPPTGDHDHSTLGAFRAMALASGGHRPETSYTTAERITNDLDESFETPEQEPRGRGWIIRRKLRACPKCHGRGFYEKRPEPAFDRFIDMVDVRMTDTITIERVECRHDPA